MLNFNEISLWRGPRELLRNLTVSIHSGEKAGITGGNGVGKSSLFGLILGELQADSGEFSLPPQAVIAHVAQETPAQETAAIDYVIDGDAPLRRIETQLQQAQQQGDGTLEAQLHAELDAIDGYRARSRAAVLLNGLGFSEEKQNLPVSQFSGGWRMRLNLAQALMCRSDILLLDEPTNHLDLDAVLWLEDWLTAYAGTLLLISHDRDFLDKICNRIAHIEHQQLTLYRGNYSDFEQARAQYLAQQQAQFDKQQRERAQMERFVERFRAKASKARQAQSRLKALERMADISIAQADSPFHFRFPAEETHAPVLLQLDEVATGYGEPNQQSALLSGVQLHIAPGERLGLLGRNGAGKSTLIKLLAGELPLWAGRREEANSLKIAYFAQHQLEQLDAQASPLLHFQRLDKTAREQDLRNFLGGFGFQGERVEEPVAPFSGGEKARLVLAMVVYQKPNLLLLDEPTNHLDLAMRHALVEALQSFDGAVCVVSHDRFLLNMVADRFCLVDQGKVEEFKGDLADYRQWLLERGRESRPTGENTANRKLKRQQAADQRRMQAPLRNELKKLEKQLAGVTGELDELNNILQDDAIYSSENKTRLLEILKKQGQLQQQLDMLEEKWLQSSEELEQN
ncbi:MAG TPA: ATP-binding cassette domain-containing protein [Gammaproteobacteria bacterium]|nr:ATP-binding cassette domain-containing protein [Gammaproteobacteria bacterium]